MKKFTLKSQLLATIIALFLSVSTSAQNPGGVTGANLWLKADAGVTATGPSLTGWTDQTGTNTFSKTGTITYNTNAFNFNPGVAIVNTDANTALPSNYLSGNTNINYVDAYAVIRKSNANCGTLIGSAVAINYGVAIFSGESDDQMWVGNGQERKYQHFSNSGLTVGNVALINFDISPTSSPYATGNLNGVSQTISAGDQGDFSQITFLPWIGGTNNSGSGNGWKHFQGDVAEIILYPSILSATEKKQIESYLALKYGISLGNNTATAIYLNSAGTSTIYVSSTYKYDVFGIGKDDGSGLYQTQSNSMNTGSGDGTGQSGKGNIVLSNPSSLDNNDFLIVGHDNSALTEQTTELPAGMTGAKRLGREWHVQRTNDPGTVSLSFDITGLTLSGTLASQYKLLLDTDNDFSSGATAVSASSITSGKVTFTGVTLTNGSYFTIITSIPDPGVAGASLWLKADAGASSNGWIDQTGTNTFTKSGTITFNTNAFNFNPGVAIVNTDANTSLPSHYLAGNTNVNCVDAFAVLRKSNANCGTLIGSAVANSYGVAIFSGESDNQMWVGNGQDRKYQSFTNSALTTGNVSLNNFDISPTSSPYATGNLNGVSQTISAGDQGDFSQITFTPWIGGTNNNGSSNGWRHFQGDVAEIILFPSSLSATDKLKIESYLAIKYGISLGNNTNVVEYLNSSGTTIWSTNTTYKYDIFGIGKDDASGLNQTQSNSMNTGSGDGTGQSGKGNIVLSNASALGNNDFMIIGHDNGALSEQTTELPASIAGSKRLAREWYVAHTGTVGTVDLSFDISGLSVTGTTVPQFKLLVDNSDHDFSTGAVTITPATSITGTTVNFTGVTLANNSYFTIVTSGISYTSNGGGDWTTPAVWIPNGVPGAGDEVTINTGHYITILGAVGGSAGLAKITIEPKGTLKGSYNVAVAAGGTLAVNGLFKIITAGQLDFKGDATVVVNGELYAGSAVAATGSTVSFSGDGVVVAGSYTNVTVPANLKADYVWTDYSISDVLWGNAANWFPSQVPGVADIISLSSNAFNALKVIDARTVAGLHLPDLATLYIEPGGSLTVAGTLHRKGVLNINSTIAGTGSLIADNITTAATGVVQVQRYVPAAGTWYLISSPAKDILQTDFGFQFADASGLQYAIGSYKENNDTWGYATQGGLNKLDIGSGYSIKVKTGVSTLTFSGTLQVGNTQATLNKNGFGWNLIGNPFTSAIKAKGTGGFLDDNTTKIDGAYQGLYIWDHTILPSGDYVVIVKDGFSFTPGPNAPGGESTIPNENIAVGQGFFVKAAAAGLVDFKATQQLHATGTEFKSAEVIDPAVRLTVQSGNLSNRAVIGFKTGLSAGLDPGYDVGKFNPNANLALYSRLMDGSSTVEFEIQGLENKDYTSLSVPLGINFKGGEAVFTLETNSAFPTDAKVYLEDTQLGKRTLLNAAGAQYSVTLPSAKGSNRFNLVVTGYKSGQISTGVDVEKQNNLFVYTRDRAIYVNGIADATDVVAVYGVDGKLHHRKPAGSAGLIQINANAYPAGIYLISIDKKQGRVTRKVVISE